MDLIYCAETVKVESEVLWLLSCISRSRRRTRTVLSQNHWSALLNCITVVFFRPTTIPVFLVTVFKKKPWLYYTPWEPLDFKVKKTIVSLVWDSKNRHVTMSIFKYIHTNTDFYRALLQIYGFNLRNADWLLIRAEVEWTKH